MHIGEISVSLIYGRIYLAVAHRRDISLAYIQTHLPRRCTSARYQSFLYTDVPTSPLYIGEISVFLIYGRIYLAVAHRRDISLSYIQTHLPRRCTSARYQSFLYTDVPTSPLYIGEISVFLIYGRIYLAVAHRRDISLSYIQTHLPRRCTSARYQSFLYADVPTSPLYIGEISVSLIYGRIYLAVAHRPDISLAYIQTHLARRCTSARYVLLIYRRTYLAVVHRRDISLSYIRTHIPRRCTSARYQSSLYTDAPTSPLHIGEISVFLICRRTYLAVVHRRDISLSYIRTHIPRRCTSARYQSCLYTDAPTSPLYIGEISVFLIYRRTYLAVVHRRDISLSYIRTDIPRRCTSARYQSFLYTGPPTSPLHIGEISVFLIYRRTYLAVVYRRDISLSYVQTHLPRRCTSARYQSCLYTDAPSSPLYMGEISVLLIYRRTYFAVVHRRDISLSYIRTHIPRRCTSARYQSSLYTDAPTSPLYIGEISVSLIYGRIYLAVAHRRDISLAHIQTHLPRRCTSARYQSFLYADVPTAPLYIGEISVSLIYGRIYLAVAHRRDISLAHIQTHLARRCTSARYQSFLYTGVPTSPLYIGEISVFLIYGRIYLAVAHRRDISLSSIQTHLPRCCISARYQSFLYTDAPTSPLYIGEISVFLIYRRTYLAVVHRRDISLSYIQTHLPHRCTSARYHSFLYADVPTSPLYIGELSVSLIYGRIYLAVAHRRDISLSYIQTHLARRCTSARCQSFLYTGVPTSPLYIGEISVFLIYGRIYLAVAHRRDISLSYIQTHLPRRCTSARYQSF